MIRPSKQKQVEQACDDHSAVWLPTSNVPQDPALPKDTSFLNQVKMGMPSMSLIVMVVLGSAVVMLLNSKRVITSTLLEERNIHLKDLEAKDVAVQQAKSEKESLEKGYKEMEDLKNKLNTDNNECHSKLSPALESAQQVDIKQRELEEKTNELDRVKGEMESIRQRESQIVQEKDNALVALNAEREKATNAENALNEANVKVANLEAQLQGEQGKVAQMQAELARAQQAAAAAAAPAPAAAAPAPIVV